MNSPLVLFPPAGLLFRYVLHERTLYFSRLEMVDKIEELMKEEDRTKSELLKRLFEDMLRNRK